MADTTRRLILVPVRPGGLLYLVAKLQYVLAQIVVAGAWHPAYSWRDNYISDLGNTACGTFSVPHGTPAYVCSPRHVLMNTSFVLIGLLLLGGTIVLWRVWPRRRLTTTALVLLVISAFGKILLGFVPENTNIGLHTLAAFNIPVGSVAILLLSLTVRREQPVIARAGFVAAIVGLAGTVASTAAEFAGHGVLLGLGVGGMERLAGYPANLWMTVLGAAVLLQTHRWPLHADAEHRASPRAGLMADA